MGDEEADEFAERRIPQLAAALHLLRIERLVVLRGGGADGVMLRRVGLDHRVAGPRAPARPPRDLREQLKRPLRRAEVRRAQPDVGQRDAHEVDGGNVQPLGDHLRADEDVRLAGGEGAQDALVGAGVGRRVAVPSERAGAGRDAERLVHKPLRAEPQVADAGAAALGASGGRAPRPAAVMASQAPRAPPILRLVVGERRRAPGAPHRVAAVAAHDRARRAAPVQKQNRLPPRPHRLLQPLPQKAAEDAAVAVAQLLPHIDDVHRGEARGRPGALDARRQREFADGAALGAPRGHDVRRGASENDDGARERGEALRGVAGVVARLRVVLLVRPLVLLVQRDEPRIVHRGEERAARADHDAALAPQDAPPLVALPSGRESAVQQPDLTRKALLETLRRLRRERDFRHEGYGALPLREAMRDSLQVHLRLAAARRAMQQVDARLHGRVVHCALDSGERGLLVGRRQQRRGIRRRVRRDRRQPLLDDARRGRPTEPFAGVRRVQPVGEARQFPQEIRPARGAGAFLCASAQIGRGRRGDEQRLPRRGLAGGALAGGRRLDLRLLRPLADEFRLDQRAGGVRGPRAERCRERGGAMPAGVRREMREQPPRAFRKALLRAGRSVVNRLEIAPPPAPNAGRQHQRERLERGRPIVVRDPYSKRDALRRQERLIVLERCDFAGVAHVGDVAQAGHHAAQRPPAKGNADEMPRADAQMGRNGVGERVAGLAGGGVHDDVGVARRAVRARLPRLRRAVVRLAQDRAPSGSIATRLPQARRAAVPRGARGGCWGRFPLARGVSGGFPLSRE